MKRLAIAFFYDGQGIVDDYYYYLLDKMREHCARLVLVVNGTLTDGSQAAARAHCDDLVIRENVGFDVWAYKTGLEHVGYDALGDYDEVLLFNHTFFGPIYPLLEMFGTMAARRCDFWGMTAHKAVAADPAINREGMAYHLNSHFIAVRRSMAASRAFRDYWADMVPIPTYASSILLHEIVFTARFEAMGFVSSAYVDPALYGSDYSAFMELDETLRRSRSPILKRRPFFHDPTFIHERGIDLPRALRIIAETSDYPVHLIWQNIVRATNARTLYTNAGLLDVLPDEPKPAAEASDYGRIAVCAHAYYDDLVPELLDCAEAIPGRYDLIVTTDTEAKKHRIERMAEGRPKIDKVIVRLTASRGRDMGALFVACHDLMTEGGYDIVCRVHTKKSPQVDAALGSMFKRHTLGNVLPGPAGVTAILDGFAANRQLGIVMPPMFHISYPTFGHAWFVNRKRTEAVAALLKIQVPLDDFSPVATYGGMFWFRPQALARVFAGWQWEDFEGEPHPIDGALAHALERVLVYAALDAGYVVKTAMTADHAAHNYTALEFKHNQLAGLLPTGDFRSQARLLASNREALWRSFLSGRPCMAPDQGEGIKRRAALDVEALKVLADARKRALDREADAVGRLERACLDLLTDDKRAAVAERIAAEVKTLRTYFKAVAGEGDGRASGPSDKDLMGYVLSQHDRDNTLSPLFDSSWYRRLYLTGDNEASPLDHFIRVGWGKGHAPHPLFSTAFYRQVRPERAAPDSVPLQGYLREGARERDTPHPLFDPAHYGEQLQDADAQPDLLVHYLQDPAARRLNPHPLFDAAYYLETNPGLAETGVAPLAHFVAEGWGDQRNPHPLFDIDYYRSQNPDLSEPGLDPLSHYVLRGWKEGLNPHPLFDTRYYLGVNPDVRQFGLNPLIHFVVYGAKEGRNPHGHFDLQFYRSFYPEVERSGVNPLVDYLSHSDHARRHPNRGFDGQSYLQDNPDVAMAGMNPLVHYVRWGRAEHRRIRPLGEAP